MRRPKPALLDGGLDDDDNAPTLDPTQPGLGLGPTGHCYHGHHDACQHRDGGLLQHGVTLLGDDGQVIYHCPCACHRDPMDVGRLF